MTEQIQLQAPSTGKSSNFLILEMNMKGLTDGVTTSEDRLYSKFFRMGSQQRNEFAKLKVYFYRKVKKSSSFTLEKKYVINKKRVNDIEEAFKEMEEEFKPLRTSIFKSIDSNWDNILKDLKKNYPSIRFDDEKLEELRPQSEEFISLGYNLTPLSSKLRDFKELRDIFSSEITNEDVAKRISQVQSEMESELKGQYEKKFQELEKSRDKLLKTLKTKKKDDYKEKLMGNVRNQLEDIEDLGEVIGESDDIKIKLQAMKESLASLKVGD